MANKFDLLVKAWKETPDATGYAIAERCDTSARYARKVKQSMWAEAKEAVAAKTVVESESVTELHKEIVGVLSDVHVPYEDKKAVAAAIEYLKEAGITKLVLLGDICDFYSVSFFKKDPRRMPFTEELEAAKTFLSDLRKTFPTIPITYIEGNHEARLYSYLVDKCPALLGVDGMDVSGALGLRGLNIEYIDNVARLVEGKGPFQIGKLAFLHGHEVRMGFSSVNLPRMMFMKTKYNTIFGHFHKQQDYITKDVFGKMLGAWSVGCLCHLSEKYMPINEWSQGFAIVRVSTKTGRFSVDNKLVYDGDVL